MTQWGIGEAKRALAYDANGSTTKEDIGDPVDDWVGMVYSDCRERRVIYAKWLVWEVLLRMSFGIVKRSVLIIVSTPFLLVFLWFQVTSLQVDLVLPAIVEQCRIKVKDVLRERKHVGLESSGTWLVEVDDFGGFKLMCDLSDSTLEDPLITWPEVSGKERFRHLIGEMILPGTVCSGLSCEVEIVIFKSGLAQIYVSE